MTTLNARANQAYREWGEEGWPADSERAVFEEAWELGYKAALTDATQNSIPFRDDEPEDIDPVTGLSHQARYHLGD